MVYCCAGYAKTGCRQATSVAGDGGGPVCRGEERTISVRRGSISACSTDAAARLCPTRTAPSVEKPKNGCAARAVYSVRWWASGGTRHQGSGGTPAGEKPFLTLFGGMGRWSRRGGDFGGVRVLTRRSFHPGQPGVRILTRRTFCRRRVLTRRPGGCNRGPSPPFPPVTTPAQSAESVFRPHAASACCWPPRRGGGHSFTGGGPAQRLLSRRGGPGTYRGRGFV